MKKLVLLVVLVLLKLTSTLATDLASQQQRQRLNNDSYKGSPCLQRFCNKVSGTVIRQTTH